MKEIRKIDYSEYKEKYDESIKEKLHTCPKEIDIESMRAFIYGYTFTEEYAQGIFPDELSMDYWSDEYEDLWDNDSDEIEGFGSMSLDDLMNVPIDMYEVSTEQERRLLEAIDSTGYGKSPETALCVTDVGQEYEYISRVFPYSGLTLKRQSVNNGIDCLEFEPNVYGVERIYFDIKRRFEVGY